MRGTGQKNHLKQMDRKNRLKEINIYFLLEINKETSNKIKIKDYPNLAGVFWQNSFSYYLQNCQDMLQ